MMHNTAIRKSFGLAILVALAGAASTATAATGSRFIWQLAPGVCGANNPANDVSLRRLPTGLKNASTGPVSVVCSMWGDDNNAVPMSVAYVYIKNEKTVGANMTCTMSAGTPYYGQVAITKTIYIAAGATSNFDWDGSDYGFSADIQWFNLQCSLPAGWSMRELQFGYSEDIGT
jgi:hypothetical protein